MKFLDIIKQLLNLTQWDFRNLKIKISKFSALESCYVVEVKELNSEYTLCVIRNEKIASFKLLDNVIMQENYMDIIKATLLIDCEIEDFKEAKKVFRKWAPITV